MRVALLDPESGNLPSLDRALRRAADMVHMRAEVSITGDPDQARRADRIVLPGQGHFRDVRESLDRNGLSEAVQEAKSAGAPILGVCVGMQLFGDGSEEDGWTAGFGWIPKRCRRLHPQNGGKVPHMGWNRIQVTTPHPALDPLDGRHVYFAHSYALDGSGAAETDHGGPVVAAAFDGSAVGVQFHPEKSQAAGLSLLAAFLSWRP